MPKETKMRSQMVWLLIGYLLIFVGTDTHAKQEHTGRGMEITTQLLGGYLASGIALGTLYYIFNPSKSGSELGGAIVELIQIAAMPPVIIFASSGSVYGIGQAWGRREGNFWKTVLGASVPPLVGGMAGGVYGQIYGKPGYGSILGGVVVGTFVGALLSPVGATIGYHLRF